MRHGGADWSKQVASSEPVKIKFDFKRYKDTDEEFECDLVAQLPGLLITEYLVSNSGSSEEPFAALRFDFIDDWYSIAAFLDCNKVPTGRYRIAIQSPLVGKDGVWRGVNLILGIEVYPDWSYVITNEETFLHAVEDGWMRVYSAAKARECMRKLCAMLDEHCLPPEVMDAVAS